MVPCGDCWTFPVFNSHRAWQCSQATGQFGCFNSWIPKDTSVDSVDWNCLILCWMRPQSGRKATCNVSFLIEFFLDVQVHARPGSVHFISLYSVSSNLFSLRACRWWPGGLSLFASLCHLCLSDASLCLLFSLLCFRLLFLPFLLIYASDGQCLFAFVLWTADRSHEAMLQKIVKTGRQDIAKVDARGFQHVQKTGRGRCVRYTMHL